MIKFFKGDVSISADTTRWWVVAGYLWMGYQVVDTSSAVGIIFGHSNKYVLLSPGIGRYEIKSLKRVSKNFLRAVYQHRAYSGYVLTKKEQSCIKY